MVAELGVGLAVLAAIGLAGQSIAVRLASRTESSNTILFYVMALNLLILVPLALAVTDEYVLTARAVLAFVGAGLVSSLVGRAFLYHGIRLVGASRSEPLKASMPLYATLLAIVVLEEQVPPLQLLGVVLIVLGVAGVSWEGARSDRVAGRAVSPIGLSLPLLAAVFFAVEPILASIGLLEGTPVLVGLIVKMVAAFVVLAAFLWSTDGLVRPRQLRAGNRRWVLLAGVANTGFIIAYYAGISMADVSVVVPIMQTSPLLVTLYSAVYLQRLERVTPKLVLATLVIVAGGVMVSVWG